MSLNVLGVSASMRPESRGALALEIALAARDGMEG